MPGQTRDEYRDDDETMLPCPAHLPNGICQVGGVSRRMAPMRMNATKSKELKRVQTVELIHICPNPEVQILFGGICSPSGVSIGPNSWPS